MSYEVRPVKFSLAEGTSSGDDITSPDAYAVYQKTDEDLLDWLMDFSVDSVDRLKASVAQLNAGSLSVNELVSIHAPDEITDEQYVKLLIANGLVENNIGDAIKTVLELVGQAGTDLSDGYRRLIEDIAQAGDSVIDLPDDIADVLSTACEFALDEDHIVEMPDEYAKQQVALQVVARYVEAAQQSAPASQTL